MKRQKGPMVVELSELIASYMYESNKRKITFEELKALHTSVSELMNFKTPSYINYNPEIQLEKISTFLPVFNVIKDAVKLNKDIDLIDMYIVLIKGLEPNKKEVLTTSVKEYIDLLSAGLIEGL